MFAATRQVHIFLFLIETPLDKVLNIPDEIQRRTDRIGPFDRGSDRLQAENNAGVWCIQAKKTFFGIGLEVGAGAGHFAAPLGIRVTVEPSSAMRQASIKRGIQGIDAVAEALPFVDNRFDAVLMVNTLCFVSDKLMSLREAFRVLRHGGMVVLAFVDRNSILGKEYEKRRSTSAFYRTGSFCTVLEMVGTLAHYGFEGFEVCQTIFTHPEKMSAPDPVKEGYGEGSFVVVKGTKPKELRC